MTDVEGDLGGRRDRFASADGTEIHYSEWGDPGDEPVVCVHGFSRTGRDFDDLAHALATEHDYRVLCPDVPGRGMSEWSDAPAEDYTREALASAIAAFCDAVGLTDFRWIGTSMGGAMGIRLAGGDLRERITHLVLNDIGPGPVEEEEEREGSERISSYLNNPPEVGTLQELEAYFRDIYGSNKPDADMRRLTVTSARRTDDGNWTPNYDPDVVGVREGDGRRWLWDEWEQVAADVLVLRGAESDILSAATADEMVEKPDCEAIEYPGVGHAPSLATDEQIGAVADFLAR